MSAFMNGGKSPRRGSMPGAGHHPEVDLADRADALLEHQAGLDERLQREQLGERLGVGSASPGICGSPSL